MALFDFLRKKDDAAEQKRDDSTTETTTPVVSDVLLQALLNSEAITREQALTLPSVSGAVDFISNMIASMPIKLYKYKDGKVEEKEDDPRVRLLNGDTGDCLDAFQMKKAMVEDYLLGRGGYCYIRRNRNDVTGLFYVKDIYVDVIPNFKPIYKDYYILVMGEEHDKDDFIKLLRNTKDGGTGTGLTKEVGTALETAYNTLLYQLNMVKSGGNKKGFLKSDTRLDQDTINVLKQAWKNLYGNNTENVVVLNKGLEFQEASQSAVETQLNESKKTLQDEINNIFHIHPDDFYLTFKTAIYPIVKAFATALNRDLLLEKEKGKMFFDFDVKEIIKANVTERYEAYKIAKETGWLTFNEIRRMENMNYIEGMDTVNVGLGAVLYDTNTHKYYTPNTDTVGDLTDETPVDENGENPTDEAIQHVITDKILDTEYEQEYQRFNPNHDGKTGRFAPGSGGGSGSSESSGSSGGSGGSSNSEGSSGGSSSSSKSDSSKGSSDSSSDKGSTGGSGGSGGSSISSKKPSEMTDEEKEAEIEKLQEEMSHTSMFDPKKQDLIDRKNMLEDDFDGTLEEYRKKKEEDKAAKLKANEEKAKFEIKAKQEQLAKQEANRKQIEEEIKTQPKEKVEQYKIIQETNPMLDDYHTGIRKPSDIKTWEETLNDPDSFSWGDFSKEDAQKALESGKITIYSSYPIKQGVFVSTSKVQAEEYAGGEGNKVYSKTISVKDVAWINGDEGQFAQTKE